MTTCLPRRPMASIRRPVTPRMNVSGSSSRSVRVHATRAPVITGPGPPPSGSSRRRRSRATVSTSGSSGIGVTIGHVPRRCGARRRRTSGTMGPSMTPSIDAARARRARIAVSMLFFAHGAIAAAVFPRLPAIKDSLGLTNAELGIAVAGLPIGGLLAGGLAGVFIARCGQPARRRRVGRRRSRRARLDRARLVVGDAVRRVPRVRACSTRRWTRR